MNMTTLTVSHNLFLTREQRYELFHGTDLEVVGVSVPVWIGNGQTTEPAIEVFAKYKLMNRDEKIFIRQHNGYYEITIPVIEAVVPPMPDDIWNSLTQQQRDEWWAANDPNPSLINLLDIKDGGCGWLAFRQYSKLSKDTGSVGVLHVIHFVEIKDISDLEQSLS